MRYVSTRGRAPKLEFEDVLLAGLARDGGLYVPESWPQFSAADINFVEAFNNFVGEGINDFELNPVFGSIPSKLVFNELELNPTKYRV